MKARMILSRNLLSSSLFIIVLLGTLSNYGSCLVPMYYGFDRPAIQHDLPPMPYSFSDLEPFIDAETVKVHYLGHHAKYKDNLNDVLKEWRKYEKESSRISILDILKNVSLIPDEYRQAFINNAGGYVNHALYWQVMSPNKAEAMRKPLGKLAEDVEENFQSFMKFKNKFTDKAVKLFGSGYVWLCRAYPNAKPMPSGESKLVILSTENQDFPLAQGLHPILVIDVWEHAYYLKHKNKRAAHIRDWWNIVDWHAVAELDQWWIGLARHDEL